MLSPLIPFIVLMVQVQSAAVNLHSPSNITSPSNTPVKREEAENRINLPQRLNIYFQVTGYPGESPEEFSEQTVKDKLNRDLLWVALPDELMSDEEEALETEQYGQNEYSALLDIATGETSWPAAEEKQPIQWLGEVGRMTFLQTRESPREFVWNLHNDDKNSASRKCYVNVNRDPHAELGYVYVNLDGQEPKVWLDWRYPKITTDSEDFEGDAGAVTVFCDPPPYGNRR